MHTPWLFSTHRSIAGLVPVVQLPCFATHHVHRTVHMSMSVAFCPINKFSTFSFVSLCNIVMAIYLGCDEMRPRCLIKTIDVGAPVHILVCPVYKRIKWRWQYSILTRLLHAASLHDIDEIWKMLPMMSS